MTLAEPSIALSDSSWLLTSTSIRHTGNEGTVECATEVGKPLYSQFESATDNLDYAFAKKEAQVL